MICITPMTSQKTIKRQSNDIQTTTIEEYKENMHKFLEFTKDIHQYTFITCWFGEDEFCKVNLKYLLEFLNQESYQGKIKINIIDEETYEILKEHFI